jgi:16S rRNA processing protein RimM
LVRLPAIESANDAARYVGATLYAHRGEIELGPGEYLDADLVGCVLVDSSGRQLGSVSAVEHYPGSDMLVVNGKLVPMVSAFIKAVDLQRSRITVDIPPGLLDDSEAEQA